MERTVVPHSSFIFSISAWMRFSEVLSSAEVDLVQYQDAGVFEEDAGQRDTLALTAGEVGSPLGQHKLIAALQLLDVGGDVGLARRRDGQNQQNQKEAGLLFPGRQGEDAFPDFRAFA